MRVKPDGIARPPRTYQLAWRPDPFAAGRLIVALLDKATGELLRERRMGRDEFRQWAAMVAAVGGRFVPAR